mgnify:CR=1 FL=1
MSILAYGLNYRTASVELRERVAFPEDYVTDALIQVKRDVAGVQEAAIISTCNRTELYCALHPEAEPDLAAWLTRYRPVSTSELEDAALDTLSREVMEETGLEVLEAEHQLHGMVIRVAW